MLTVIADTPAAAATLLGGGASRRLAVARLPARLGSAWQVLTPAVGGDAWTGVVGVPGADGAAPHPVLVVERAVGSQFVALQGALRDGLELPDDLTCLAMEGDGFRGQRGRSWAAERGNLHLCRLARLDVSAAAAQAALTALPAVASTVAIQRASLGGVTPGIKWVNDVMVAGHKVGGVIAATHVVAGRVTHAVFGIGINVGTTPAVERDPRTAPAGSLHGLAADAAPGLHDLTLALVAELSSAIDRLRSGSADAIVADYRRRSLAVGRRVAVWPVGDVEPAAAPLRVATVRAIHDDLTLELDDGGMVHSGRITFVDGAVMDGVGDAS